MYYLMFETIFIFRLRYTPLNSFEIKFSNNWIHLHWEFLEYCYSSNTQQSILLGISDWKIFNHWWVKSLFVYMFFPFVVLNIISIKAIIFFIFKCHDENFTIFPINWLMILKIRHSSWSICLDIHVCNNRLCSIFLSIISFVIISFLHFIFLKIKTKFVKLLKTLDLRFN